MDKDNFLIAVQEKLPQHKIISYEILSENNSSYIVSAYTVSGKNHGILLLVVRKSSKEIVRSWAIRNDMFEKMAHLYSKINKNSIEVLYGIN